MKVSEIHLGRNFYQQQDVVQMARALLGKVICSRKEGQLCRAMITETEAYRGRDDKACHANNGKFTPRTATMYQQGGTAYIYLCYGIHHLFNVVTNKEGTADAVLVRAAALIEGEEIVAERLNTAQVNERSLAGPGKLTKALGIKTSDDGLDLVNDPTLYLTHGEHHNFQIKAAKRIGVEYAGEDAQRPWRFYIIGNKTVSKFEG